MRICSRLPATGLRFFTVYGPWGRPDMAMWLFAAAILAGRPIKLFNRGDMRRDFTYVDDVATAVVKLIDIVPQGNAAWSGDDPDPATQPCALARLQYRQPHAGRTHGGRAAARSRARQESGRELLPMQPGDVQETFADVEALRQAVGFAPDTPIAVGIKAFVDWYRAFHGV